MIVIGIAIYDNSAKELKDFNHVYLTTHRIYIMFHSDNTSSSIQSDHGISCPLSSIEKVEKESGGFFRSPKIKFTIKSSNFSISFRKGKRDEFYDHLQDQLKKKKWTEDVNNAMQISTSMDSISSLTTDSSNNNNKNVKKDFTTSTAGVAGIMKRIDQENLEERKEMDDAFSDLKKLMEKAEDMVNMAENYKNKIVQRMKNDTEATSEETEEEKQILDFLLNLGLASPVTKQSTGALYHQQLARQLIDFLDKIVQERYGGVITLSDAYCLYNRARGTDLISPEDMEKACSLFEKLKLPMKLKVFDSGVIVIQSSQYSDRMMAEKIAEFIRDGHECDVMTYKFITAVRLAQLLNVSIVLAKELLLTAEHNRTLCRDENEEGIRFYLVSDVFDKFI
ncbi:predicted protein [Naegleria gruberi]|uniref:Vacuolar protein-sorting-associated protein 36 n=1 Tax=Naegleria gruberi TaxID=5762 RepID=D2VNF2_NAEGR|nr:uncharacterized protein NAEGRDRAFT_50985 [Naegleria gruberi]EFC41649.1 predicted protein [Naegleria gruberi]|eukprot:XP_002674393.1 predicted protein [Naegleria gruberi strain NEG-M]